MREHWPRLHYPTWKDTGTAVHLWCQIVGKYRLAYTPWINHAWHATLYVTPRGLTTGAIPDPSGVISLSFDFCDHTLKAEAENGRREQFSLQPMSVSTFLERTRNLIRSVGGTPRMHGRPNELPDPVPFRADAAMRPYDCQATEDLHAALVSADRVFKHFRTSFLGKVSPVHLFWGSFDLAVTRFSGRRAPMHPGGIPSLPDAVTREAYSHEVSSAGFWPGGSGVEEASFYSYAYPSPEAFKFHRVSPREAYFHESLGEFLLPYEAVRSAADPEAALMGFLQSSYAAAANAGSWDRSALECELGLPGQPRAVTSW